VERGGEEVGEDYCRIPKAGDLFLRLTTVRTMKDAKGHIERRHSGSDLDAANNRLFSSNIYTEDAHSHHRRTAYRFPSSELAFRPMHRDVSFLLHSLFGAPPGSWRSFFKSRTFLLFRDYWPAPTEPG
jgi:hypothetical protein